MGLPNAGTVGYQHPEMGEPSDGGQGVLGVVSGAPMGSPPIQKPTPAQEDSAARVNKTGKYYYPPPATAGVDSTAAPDLDFEFIGHPKRISGSSDGNGSDAGSTGITPAPKSRVPQFNRMTATPEELKAHDDSVKAVNRAKFPQSKHSGGIR